jgi:GNAT superfamily N-acetyltransferase
MENKNFFLLNKKDNNLIEIIDKNIKLEKDGFKLITIFHNEYKSKSGMKIRYVLYEGIVEKEEEGKALSYCSFSIEDKSTINDEFIKAEKYLIDSCKIKKEEVIKNESISISSPNTILKNNLDYNLIKNKTLKRQTVDSKTYVLDLIYVNTDRRGEGLGRTILDYGISSIKKTMKKEDCMYLNAAPTIRTEENVSKLVNLYNKRGFKTILNKKDWEVMIAFKEDLKDLRIIKKDFSLKI